MLSNFVISLIRTWVPVAVGTVIAWLSHRYSWVDIDTASATAWAVGATIGVYYTIVRWLETKFPSLGVLLGHKAKPVYVLPPPKQELPKAA